MAAVFSFGSFGDIVTIIQLTCTLTNALSESTGSSVEYQELISELDALSRVLDYLQHVAKHQELHPSAQRAISHALARCRTLMDDFLSRIGGYKRRLKQGGSGNRWKDSWRKIGWALFKKSELVELKNNLMAQKMTINVVLSASHSMALQDFAQTTQRQVHHQTEVLGTVLTKEQAVLLADAERRHAELLGVMRMNPEDEKKARDQLNNSLASEMRALGDQIAMLRREQSSFQRDIEHPLTTTLGSGDDSRLPLDVGDTSTEQRLPSPSTSNTFTDQDDSDRRIDAIFSSLQAPKTSNVHSAPSSGWRRARTLGLVPRKAKMGSVSLPGAWRLKPTKIIPEDSPGLFGPSSPKIVVAGLQNADLPETSQESDMKDSSLQPVFLEPLSSNNSLIDLSHLSSPGSVATNEIGKENGSEDSILLAAEPTSSMLLEPVSPGGSSIDSSSTPSLTYSESTESDAESRYDVAELTYRPSQSAWIAKSETTDTSVKEWHHFQKEYARRQQEVFRLELERVERLRAQGCQPF